MVRFRLSLSSMWIDSIDKPKPLKQKLPEVSLWLYGGDSPLFGLVSDLTII